MKSKAKVSVETDTKTTFAEVVGVYQAKAGLKETVDFLKRPGQNGGLGARIPMGSVCSPAVLKGHGTQPRSR